MTTRIDDILSARFQACCINFNEYIKRLFGEELAIEKHLSFSLQFSTISAEQKALLEEYKDMPANIRGFIQGFDAMLSSDEFNNSRYAYRIIFIPKTANRKGQADRVIEFVKSDSPLAETLNREYAVIKETEKPKYLPKQIVEQMKAEGFQNFTMHHHTQLWKSLDAQNPTNGYGTLVAGKHWHWYENWVEVVRKHCQENQSVFA